MTIEHSTLKAARKSFESTIGKPAHRAQLEDVEKWLGILRSLGRATATCRTYMLLVSKTAGLKVTLPRRDRTSKRALSNEDLRLMLKTSSVQQYALIAGLILAGEDSLGWTWGDVMSMTSGVPIPARIALINEAKRRGFSIAPFMSASGKAHILGGPNRNEIAMPLARHEVNRKLKSIAKKAGIDTQGVNVSALKRAHARLALEHGDVQQIARALGITRYMTDAASKPERDTRLHGIGRRSLITTA